MTPPLDSHAIAGLKRSHGRYIFHGTDVHRVDSIVTYGLQPGGGNESCLDNLEEATEISSPKKHSCL